MRPTAGWQRSFFADRNSGIRVTAGSRVASHPCVGIGTTAKLGITSFVPPFQQVFPFRQALPFQQAIPFQQAFPRASSYSAEFDKSANYPRGKCSFVHGRRRQKTHGLPRPSRLRLLGLLETARTGRISLPVDSVQSSKQIVPCLVTIRPSSNQNGKDTGKIGPLFRHLNYPQDASCTF
jgi:hypothetical protein